MDLSLSDSFLSERRILVVEDDYLIAQEVRRDLEAAGATVVGPVPSVERALQLLDSDPVVHAGVLDVNLGVENSFPIAEALEARGIPYLFATGYNSADIPAKWRHAMIVMKPFHVDAVERLLAGGGV